MQLGTDHVVVTVPATSANLGPGFDALGLALAIYDRVEVELVASPQIVVNVVGEGAGKVPTDGRHLVARAVQHTLEWAGAPLTGMVMTCTNAIPHGRGLGSSAAAVVAGIAAGRALLAEPDVVGVDQVLAIATEFEGHPDNAAPAISGGATLAWMRGHLPQSVSLELDPGIVATVVIPRERLATSTARAVLPVQVPHSDAAFNAGRSALMVEALARRPELLFDASQDRLHQDYRAAVMPASHSMLTTLRDAGFAATISGAGPTVLVLSTGDELPDLDRLLGTMIGPGTGWYSLRPGIDHQGARSSRVGRR